MNTKDLILAGSVLAVSLIFACPLTAAQERDESHVPKQLEYMILLDGSIKTRNELVIGDVVLGPVPEARIVDTETMTVGPTTSFCSHPSYQIYGSSASVIGSPSSTELSGRRIVNRITDPEGTCTTSFSMISISGFVTNPGPSWLSSVTCDGATMVGNAASFAYNRGIASWIWTQPFAPAEVQPGTLNCTLAHE